MKIISTLSKMEKNAQMTIAITFHKSLSLMEDAIDVATINMLIQLKGHVLKILESLIQKSLQF